MSNPARVLNPGRVFLGKLIFGKYPGSSDDAHGKGLNGSEIFLKERGYYDIMEKVWSNNPGNCLVCRQ